MIHPTETTELLITLDVGKRNVLYLKFFEDGTVIRLGNGGTDCKDRHPHTGQFDPAIFEELKSSINPKMNEFFGNRYNDKVKEGEICKLVVMSKTSGTLSGFEFIHGELSDRPPSEAMDFVVKAVQLTEDWFIEQSNIRLSMRPWWKFW